MDYLKKCVIALNIKNIRILKKIEKLVKEMLELSKNYEIGLIQQSIHTLVLFTWSRYSYKNDFSIPPPQFIIDVGKRILGSGSVESKEDIEKDWISLLDNYGYGSTDELDLFLAEGVNSGYFPKKSFIDIAFEINKIYISKREQDSFTEAWSLYHHSFDNNGKEVLDKLYESFLANAKNISTLNLNGTVRLFKDLGNAKRANELIDYYVEARKNEPKIFDLTENTFWGDITEKEILKKFEKQYLKVRSPETPLEILERIRKKQGWSKKDTSQLSLLSSDDFYILFKSIKDRRLTSYINICLRFGKMSDTDDKCKMISDNTIEALKLIEAESPINKRRIKKFEIS